MPPTLNRTFTKLLTYSIAMVAVPFAAYKLAGDVVLAGQMEDAGQRAVYAGVAAVVGVNAVLVSYVGSALWEGGGGTDRKSREEEDGKKDD